MKDYARDLASVVLFMIACTVAVAIPPEIFDNPWVCVAVCAVAVIGVVVLHIIVQNWLYKKSHD